MTAERDALAVLRELVACRDLKDQADYNLLYAQTTGSRELGKKLTEEYRHRKGAAWAAARVVLAAQTDNDQSGGVASATRKDAGTTHCSPASDSPGVTLSTSPDPIAAPAQDMWTRPFNHAVPPFAAPAQGEPQPIGWTDGTAATGHRVIVRLADGVSLPVGTPLYAAPAAPVAHPAEPPATDDGMPLMIATTEVLHVLRNPHGYEDAYVRAIRCEAADLIERQAREIAGVKNMLQSVANACSRAEHGWKEESDDGDAVLITITLDPERYRTEGGRLNVPKIRAAIAERQSRSIRDGIAAQDAIARLSDERDKLLYRIDLCDELNKAANIRAARAKVGKP